MFALALLCLRGLQDGSEYFQSRKCGLMGLGFLSPVAEPVAKGFCRPCASHIDTFSKSGMSGVKGGAVKGCGWSG